MLTPDYLAALPDTLVALYAGAEQDILSDMARRISTYDYWIPAADYQYRKLIEMGAVHDNVLAELSKRTGRTSAELAQLMDKAGQKAVDADGAIYEAHGLSPPPLLATPELKKVLESGLKQTDGLFQNLTATTANTVTRQFENALDRAWMQISTGAFDHNAAVRTAIKDLSRQGVGAITYPTGHVDTVEVAVRRAAVTGVNQTALKLQDALADEMGSDLVEVTAHGGARPDHAAWQGGVYSRSGTSKKYKGLRAVTEYGSGPGLGGWNCRHSFFPYFDGSPRAYTSEMLEGFEAKSYTYNDQKLTEYEAAQRQRYGERQIRRWKRENAAMEAAGLDTAESAAKIKQWQDTQKDFLKQTGLKRQGGREQIGGATGVAKSAGSGIIKPTKEVPPPFTPAKSVKEAEQFAREALGIPRVSYKGCDVAIANEWNRGLQDSFQRFPALRENFGFVGECHERNAQLKPFAHGSYLDDLRARNPGMSDAVLEPYAVKRVKELMQSMRVSTHTLAESWAPAGRFEPFRGVSVNRDMGKSAEALQRTLHGDVEMQFHPVGCDSIRSVLDHEIGHQLDGMLNIGRNPEIQSLFDSRTTEQLTDDLSRYAWQNTNKNTYSEMIAEAWAEYCNNPTPRDIANTVGELIEREYLKLYGKD